VTYSTQTSRLAQQTSSQVERKKAVGEGLRVFSLDGCRHDIGCVDVARDAPIPESYKAETPRARVVLGFTGSQTRGSQLRERAFR